MDTKKPNDLKFLIGDKRMYKGQAYEVVAYRGNTLGVYVLVKFPFPKGEQPRQGVDTRTVPRIVFEQLSTELTGMIGAVFGD